MKMLFGGILIAVGILIAGASGICSAAMLFGGGFGAGSGMDSFLSMLPVVALFGGPPIAAGVGMVFGGRALVRSAKRDAEGPRL